MKKIMMALAMCFMFIGIESTAQQASEGRMSIADRLEALESTLRNAIILTDQPCERLGRLGIGWIPYGPMAGRFPLAAGEGKDDREVNRDFVLGNEGGEYAHQLTVNEMPKHAHPYMDFHFDNSRRGSDRGDDDDQERNLRRPTRNTDTIGGNEAHNNMPPYRVLNFCWQRR